MDGKHFVREVMVATGVDELRFDSYMRANCHYSFNLWAKIFSRLILETVRMFWMRLHRSSP